MSKQHFRPYWFSAFRAVRALRLQKNFIFRAPFAQILHSENWKPKVGFWSFPPRRRPKYKLVCDKCKYFWLRVRFPIFVFTMEMAGSGLWLYAFVIQRFAPNVRPRVLRTGVYLPIVGLTAFSLSFRLLSKLEIQSRGQRTLRAASKAREAQAIFFRNPPRESKCRQQIENGITQRSIKP